MNMTIFILLVASICSSGVATAGSPDSAPLPAHAVPQPGIEVDHAARRMPRLAFSIPGSASTATEVSTAGTTPETTTSEATKELAPDITSTFAIPQTTPPGSTLVSSTPLPPSSSTLASTATTSELASPATTPETSSTDAALQTTTTYTYTTTTITFTSQRHTTAGTTSTSETTSGTTPELTPGASSTTTSPGTSTKSTPAAGTTDINTENSTEPAPPASATDTSPGTSTEPTPTASTTDISTENSTESTPAASTTDTSPGTSTLESTPAASTTDTSPGTSTLESTPAANTTDTSPGTSTLESTPPANTTDTSPGTSTLESTPPASTTDTSPGTSTPESTPTSTVSVSPTITSFPSTCSADPGRTAIEAQITLPRTLVVAWGNSAPPTVTVCLQDDCRTTAESSVQFDEVTVGQSLLVSVNGTDFYDCVELFVPWQFRVGVAAHNLILDWVNFSPRLLNVCLARDIGHFPSHSSWIDCIETTNSSVLFSGLEPDTPFWIRVGEATVFYATTPPDAKYRSLAFRCHETGVCTSGECRPASDGLILALDWVSPVPASYPYVCVNKDNAQSSPATTLAASSVVAVTSVVFASGGLEQDVDECIHTTALAVVKYWCDGMVNCTVEHSLLHSHLAVAEGCVDTRLDQYSLHIEYESVVLSAPACSAGTSLFDPHKTCYDVEPSPDFLARRRSCMKAGGDIAFYDSDPAFLQFLNESFGLSEEGLIVQGIIGDDVRPREPQLYAEDVDIYHINFAIHYAMSHHSFASDVPILCAYPPLVGIPGRLETATIADDPCWGSPCLNGGTCFNTTLALNAASGDDFMCLCGQGYSGNLCENADTGIKDEPQDPLGGVYSFSAPFGEALSFEFVFFGRVWAESQSCYAPAALALFRLKCDGQSQCEVSYKDLHHHLHSSCHPAVTPTLRVRYATYEYPESWSCGNESLVESTCLGTSADQFPSAQDAKLYCAGLGGDLASMEDLTPFLCLNNASSLWVDNATDFYAHPHYALTPNNPTSISCDGQTHQRHTALCVFPFVLSDSNSTTTETTTISTTEESTTISTTEESTTISTTEESTTISTTEESTTISTTEETTTISTTEVTTTVSTTKLTTPKITPTASTTSTTTTTTPGPCPKTRPFPSAYPDYVWKQEEPGTIAKKDCPKPKNVTVNWLCKANGNWKGLPDLSLCSTIDTGHWEDEIKNSTENAGDSLNNFLNVTESQELEPGDVTGTLNILGAARERHIEDLKKMNESEVLNATDVYTDAVTKTTNKMLQQPEVWFGLPDEARANASTALQEEVEAAAVEVAYLLVNESRNYETETVSINAKRHSKDHFERTENRIFYHKDRTETMLELPEKFFEDMDDDLVAVSFTSYSTLHCVLGKSIICEPQDLHEVSPDEGRDTFPLPELVNTPVMGLTIGNASWNFSDGTGVKATFRDYFGSDIYNLSTATCVSWNVANEQWSPDGCELAFQTGTATVCTCSHLTNLAVIVDVNGVFGKSPFLQWFTVVGCSISLVCLVLAIVTLSLLLHKRRRNKTTIIIHLHLCCCLFVAELILLVGLDRTEDEVGCGVVAGFLHYFLLATFCWMGVEGVNVYFLVVKVFLTARSPLRYYTVVAYTAPALVVAVSAAVDSEGYGTEDYCWLSTENGLIWAFTGPALVILLVNFVMFGFGVRAYLSTNSSTGVRGGGRGNAEGTSKGEKRRLLRGSVILSSVLGLTWILGYFMMFGGSAAYAMAVLFTVVNSLQGAVLFVVMVLMNPTARTQLKLVLCCGCNKGLTNFPSSFTRSSRLDPSESFRKALENSSPDIPRQVPINPRGSGELDMWVAKEMSGRPGRRR